MPQKKYISIRDCPICKHLDNYESGFQKYGWEEDDTFLPKIADELVWMSEKEAEKIDGMYKVCPECGTYYDYDSGYDYIVNGSEDYQDLYRLTPTQVKKLYTVKEYEWIVSKVSEGVRSRNKIYKKYAIRTIVDYQLDKKEYKPLEKLLTHKSKTIKLFTIRRLWHWTGDNKRRLVKSEMRKLLELIQGRSDNNLVRIKNYILEDLK